MVSEVILNLTKSIEILLSPNRDRARARARKWGFSDDEVEQIIPLFHLRNHLDVAHVTTGPLTAGDRDRVLEFTNIVLVHVQEFLTRVSEGIISGTIALDPVSKSLNSDKAKLLKALKEYFEKDRAK